MVVPLLLTGARTVVAGALVGSTPAPPSVDEAGARADEILSRPEFAPPDRSLVDRVFDWIGERVSDLLGDLLGGGQGSAVSWVVLGLCAAVVAFVVFLVVRNLRRDPVVEGIVDEGAVARSPADWKAEAERFEAAGSYKAALRARYRHLIAELVNRSVIRDVAGRTTGEYRSEMRRRSPGVADDFDAASGLFEAAWYGDVPTGADENRAFRDHAARVLSGIQRKPDHDHDRDRGVERTVTAVGP